MNVNIYIDESGSMGGARLAVVHALTMGLRHNPSITTPRVYGFSGPREFRQYPAPSDMLTSFYGGGTTFEHVLRNVLDAADEDDVTAIIFTDGYCIVDPVLEQAIRNHPRIRVIAVTLDEHPVAEGGITAVADKTVKLLDRVLQYNPRVLDLLLTAVAEVWQDPPQEETADPAEEFIQEAIAVIEEAVQAGRAFLDEWLKRTRT